MIDSAPLPVPEPGIGLLLGGSCTDNGNSFDLLVGGACVCGMVGSCCNCICCEGATVDLVTGGAVIVDGGFCNCKSIEPAGPDSTTVLSGVNGVPSLLFLT